ncbi:hypothetical protein [Paramicrobacterium agarici]|uniref:Uncharacterized protein n=1 Tax=Paramicrobacterium agarici TaxID=630514 RepID=A0A2A9DRW0_9MICO|nr:hypothetical protein [Microbacterium agarici]PFG29408.1 hypothetical protein ATJ78_0313 [Microbacterium agarici]TQO22416.1 hypothetical protein FB385_1246 [Microbacterium agarici]
MTRRRTSRTGTSWHVALAALLVVGSGAIALPASAQWSASSLARVSVEAGYPPITVNSGRWLSCRGPQAYNGYEASIGGDFSAVQYLYRDQIEPVFANFRIYRVIDGVTEWSDWSSEPAGILGDASEYNYMFHDRGTNFYNLPTDNSPMTVYVRPMYPDGWLGPASNSITIYPRDDLNQSYCQSP